MDGETIVTLTDKGKTAFKKENTGISFSKALSLLKLGMKVKRKHWGGYWFLSKSPVCEEKLEDGYTRSFEFQKGLIVAVLKDSGGCAPATPYQGDLLADDWEVTID